MGKGYKLFLAAIDTGNGFALVIRPSMVSRVCGGILLLIAGFLWAWVIAERVKDGES